MANSLTPTLTLNSNTAPTNSPPLVFTETDVLATATPLVETSQVTVGTATAHQILDSTIQTAATYVYLKNEDALNSVLVKTDAGVTFGKLHPGEFCFFCVNVSEGLEVIALVASCIVEIGYWSKA